MGVIKIESQKRYTYADYAEWAEYPRFELINGEAIKLNSLTILQNRVRTSLMMVLYAFLKGKTPQMIQAPFDVRINYDTLDNIVLQPDLFVVCDPAKLENGKSCMGVPDLVIEILSESTRRHDTLRKFNLYRNAGVREYWLADPESKAVSVHILKDGEYFTKLYFEEDTIPVHVLDGCEIKLSEVLV